MSGRHTADQGEGTLRSYGIGFALSLVLSAVPFALVMSSAVSGPAIVVIIAVFAIAQIGVHLVFFLHLGRASSERWNVVVFAYTVVVLAILVGASLWIMYHLGSNMMIH